MRLAQASTAADPTRMRTFSPTAIFRTIAMNPADGAHLAGQSVAFCGQLSQVAVRLPFGGARPKPIWADVFLHVSSDSPALSHLAPDRRRSASWFPSSSLRGTSWLPTAGSTFLVPKLSLREPLLPCHHRPPGSRGPVSPRLPTMVNPSNTLNLRPSPITRPIRNDRHPAAQSKPFRGGMLFPPAFGPLRFRDDSPRLIGVLFSSMAGDWPRPPRARRSPWRQRAAIRAWPLRSTRISARSIAARKTPN